MNYILEAIKDNGIEDFSMWTKDTLKMFLENFFDLDYLEYIFYTDCMIEDFKNDINMFAQGHLDISIVLYTYEDEIEKKYIEIVNDMTDQLSLFLCQNITVHVLTPAHRYKKEYNAKE